MTPYLDTLETATVRVYDEAAVDGAPPLVNCPDTGLDADCTDDDVPCFFQFDYDPSALEDGGHYSLFLTGFEDNTNTCAIPDVGAVPCPTAAISATIEEDEDASDVVADNARVRLFQGIHNLPPVDLCYDLDGFAMANAAPTLIHGLVGQDSLTDYVTVPPVTTGIVFLTMKTAELATLADCGLSATPAASGLPSNVIPVFFSAADAQAQTPTPRIAANTVLTIFVTGDTRYATRPAGEPMQNAEWANYQARVPLPLAFFEVAPPAP